jgi:hypothetical protein
MDDVITFFVTFIKIKVVLASIIWSAGKYNLDGVRDSIYGGEAEKYNREFK